MFGLYTNFTLLIQNFSLLIANFTVILKLFYDRNFGLRLEWFKVLLEKNRFCLQLLLLKGFLFNWLAIFFHLFGFNSFMCFRTLNYCGATKLLAVKATVETTRNIHVALADIAILPDN